jgi:UDP-glucose 4-epimerase
LVDTKKIKFVECDLTNENRIKTVGPLLQNVDFLVHLSSEFRFPEPNSLSSAHHTVELDIKGTILLLQQLKQLQGILFTSSAAVYGKPSYLPTDELCPIRPISFYGCSKFATEKYLKLHSNNKNVPLTILRISNVYGQRDRSNQMIPIFTRKALRNELIKLNENGSRDLIHISDVIEAIMSAIKLNQNNLFNIGTGIKFSNHFILKKIIEITKSQSKILRLEKSEDDDFVYDISKATAKLGINPKVSIERGLVDEILWHKKQI